MTSETVQHSAHASEAEFTIYVDTPLRARYEADDEEESDGEESEEEGEEEEEDDEEDDASADASPPPKKKRGARKQAPWKDPAPRAPPKAPQPASIDMTGWDSD